ncbi:hypothetical protein AAVH_32500 [Aphelenchoides avenae]|nr:hypothetical protein AAVH_32500 [Aphelenchus avenae]
MSDKKIKPYTSSSHAGPQAGVDVGGSRGATVGHGPGGVGAGYYQDTRYGRVRYEVTRDRDGTTGTRVSCSIL